MYLNNSMVIKIVGVCAASTTLSYAKIETKKRLTNADYLLTH